MKYRAHRMHLWSSLSRFTVRLWHDPFLRPNCRHSRLFRFLNILYDHVSMISDLLTVMCRAMRPIVSWKTFPVNGRVVRQILGGFRQWHSWNAWISTAACVCPMRRVVPNAECLFITMLCRVTGGPHICVALRCWKPLLSSYAYLDRYRTPIGRTLGRRHSIAQHFIALLVTIIRSKYIIDY